MGSKQVVKSEASALHTKRERLHIFLFIIGLTMMVSGTAAAVGGPNIWFRWQPRSAVLAEDALLEIADSYPDARWGFLTPGRQAYAYRVSEEQMSLDAVDIEVEGNITAEGDYLLDLVALNWWEWRSWDAGGDYNAYAEAYNVTSFSFTYNLPRDWK